jgi:hypothetical protein
MLWVLAAWVVWWAGPRAAGAHEFRPALLDLTAHADGTVTMRWTPPTMTARGPVNGALRPQLPSHCRELLPTVGTFDCGGRGLAGEVSVAGLRAYPTDVLVSVTHADGRQRRGRISADAPSMPLGAGAPVDSTVGACVGYLQLGGTHILGGLDHLMLLLGLLALARGPRALIAAVTGFTLGHCVTLLAVVLAGVTLAGPPVEATITLSVVFVAVEVRRGPPSFGHAHPGRFAVAIGLLHGLGFAGALVEIGLPSQHLVAAVVGFNLGVEAGQLAVVLALCGVGVALSRVWSADRLRQAAAWIVGHVAAAWTLARIVDMAGGS